VSTRRTPWFAILILGWVLYGISLAVPAVIADDPFGSDIHAGLDAAGYAITGLFLDAPWYGVPSGLTNLIFLWSLWAIRRPKPSLTFGMIMVSLAVFNLGWLTEPMKGDYDELLIGYYLWISAFVLVGSAHIWGYLQAVIQDENPGSKS
jgi:hypothetical protein